MTEVTSQVTQKSDNWDEHAMLWPSELAMQLGQDMMFKL
jgi:hypothetical protein